MKRSLEDRIWNNVPVTHPAFTKLLGLLVITESREVRSAAVTLGVRSRLLINPDFVKAYCKTDASLATLVLHELYHVLLGHTRLLEQTTPLQNFVFDAVINAQLAMQFPQSEHTALFRACYRADVFPEALLRPPDGWDTAAPDWALEGDALRLHQTLYTQGSATCAEIFDLLQTELKKTNVSVKKIRLLGDHRPRLLAQRESLPSNAGTALLEEVSRLAIPCLPRKKTSGRGAGERLVRERVRVSPAEEDAARTLRRAVRTLLDLDRSCHGALSWRRAPAAAMTPLRTPRDRKAVVQEACSYTPLLYASMLDVFAPHSQGRVHVYLDVSGSVAAVLPLVIGALAPLEKYLHPRAHLFSTQVATLPWRQVRQGSISTTGGTDIQCVTEHMLEHRISNAVLITDGVVGPVPEEHLHLLRRRRVRINTVLTFQGCRDMCAPISRQIYELPWTC